MMHACSVASVVSDSSRPHRTVAPPGSSVYRILQARILEWVAMPTQGWNPGLLRCRWMLSPLSHQGSTPVSK